MTSTNSLQLTLYTEWVSVFGLSTSIDLLITSPLAHYFQVNFSSSIMKIKINIFNFIIIKKWLIFTGLVTALINCYQHYRTLRASPSAVPKKPVAAHHSNLSHYQPAHSASFPGMLVSIWHSCTNYNHPLHHDIHLDPPKTHTIRFICCSNVSLAQAVSAWPHHSTSSYTFKSSRSDYCMQMFTSRWFFYLPRICMLLFISIKKR